MAEALRMSEYGWQTINEWENGHQADLFWSFNPMPGNLDVLARMGPLTITRNKDGARTLWIDDQPAAFGSMETISLHPALVKQRSTGMPAALSDRDERLPGG